MWSTKNLPPFQTIERLPIFVENSFKTGQDKTQLINEEIE